MDKIKINLEDLLLCMSNAQDLMSPHLSKHHEKVAYLAFRLAEQMKLPVEQQKDIFLAALVHDIGALSVDEKLDIIENESITINNHAWKGAKLIEKFYPLQKSSNIIKFHHIPWNNGDGHIFKGEEVPIESHIIHLADRVCAMSRSDRTVISKLPEIISAICSKSNSIYIPEIVEALQKLSTKEYIWLDLISDSPVKTMKNSDLLGVINLDIDDVIELALIFSQIIDFRSHFTARHSVGVAKTAQCLAGFVGFSPYECKMMLIAGYLHDLGKLAISNKILDKPGKLCEDEFNIIRSHTYYTYRLLEPIAAFHTINQWASYHHEKLDGTGYPFHIEGENIPLGSRVMAVADVFTAITEDRPYRKSMDDDSAKEILKNMVTSGALDGKIVNILIDNFETVNNICRQAQEEQTKRYENYLI